MNKKIPIVTALILAGVAYLLVKPGNRIHYDLPEWKAPAREDVSGISWGKGETTSLRREGGAWVLGDPARKADEDRVGKILDALENLKATDMVSSSGYYGTYSLEEGDRISVKVEAAGGEEEFLFGKKASSQGTYGLLPGEEGVLILTGDWNSLLPADPGELRDRNVLTFDKDRVGIVELSERDTGRRVVFSRDDQGAWMKNGESYGSGEDLEKKIASLAALKCRSYVSDPPREGVPQWKALLSVDGAETGFSVWEERDGSYLCSSTQSEDLFLIPSYTINGLSGLLDD